MRTRSEKLPALLDRFCAMPRAKRELAGGRRIGKAKGHSLPMGAYVSPIAFPRAMLLGDAAGFINPLTGEGIEFAMETFDLNHKMQRFFETPRLVDRVFKAANKSPRVTNELADVLLGEDPKITWRLAVALALGV
jgi:2-polyprenyl-6-methoxyphenol hydroxylase-like FAD-dependent oxidoreductase